MGIWRELAGRNLSVRVGALPTFGCRRIQGARRRAGDLGIEPVPREECVRALAPSTRVTDARFEVLGPLVHTTAASLLDR